MTVNADNTVTDLPHSCDSLEVAVETFNPIGGIDHGLYLRGISGKS